MRVGFLERPLSTFFYHYAGFVAQNPGPFLAVPLVLTAVFSVGLFRYSDALLKDELELYTPVNARARREFHILDSLFHINDSDPYYVSRRYDIRRVGYVVVTSAQKNGDILANPNVVESIIQLWRAIQAITISSADSSSKSNRENGKTNYMSICVKFPMLDELSMTLSALLKLNLTSSNPLVELFLFLLNDDVRQQNSSAPFSGTITSLFETAKKLNFTKLVQSFSTETFGIRNLFGGITLDPRTRKIAGAKALMLPYALKHATKAEDRLAEKLIAPCFFVIFVYTVFMCCTLSPVYSRPLYAVCGVLSVLMAIVSGVGVLLLAGFTMTSICYSIPFIVFSVGVDNVFIFLSAWRATEPNPTGDFRERHCTAFRDAAVSVTITSVTDMISFSIGYMTPYQSVQTFCVYAVVCILFTYFYHITFLAAILALTSVRETQSRHCLTMRVVQKRTAGSPIENATDFDRTLKSLSLRLSLAMRKGSALQHYANNEKKNPAGNHFVSAFFRDQYADFLLNPIVRQIVLLFTVLYLAVSVYGCWNLELGMEPNDLLPVDSYGREALRIVETYFPEQGEHLHVVMYNLSSVNLGHRRPWLILEREIELYEFNDFTGAGDSWLREFLYWQHSSKKVQTTNENFIPHLQQFLNLTEFAKYKRDVILSPDQQKLEASRVPIHLRHIGFQNQSRAMWMFRRIAETSELPTIVYADFFMFAEQHNSLVFETLTSIGFACVAVVLVCLCCIPEPSAALWVSMSVLSINLGTFGLMTFWSVRLDFISMVTIVTSIGFCVDFSAHLAVTVSRGEDEKPLTERIRNALYAVGTPILQSASSTVIGISFLVHTESYIFQTFFKTILLVMVLGVIHGIVILPVLLTLFGPNTGSNIIREHIKSVKRKRNGEGSSMAMEISPPIPNFNYSGGAVGGISSPYGTTNHLMMARNYGLFPAALGANGTGTLRNECVPSRSELTTMNVWTTTVTERSRENSTHWSSSSETETTHSTDSIAAGSRRLQRHFDTVTDHGYLHQQRNHNHNEGETMDHRSQRKHEQMLRQIPPPPNARKKRSQNKNKNSASPKSGNRIIHQF